MITSDVSVAVLAGGKSRRLGRDKALVRLIPGDATLLELVLARVRHLSDDVYVIATDRPVYATFGAPVLPDRYPEAGVLGGIATALRYARHQACLVVSCDHPFLNPILLGTIIATLGEWDVVVPTIPGSSRQGGTRIRQTLHAIYHRRCLPAIERAIEAGRLQIVSFFDDVRVREIDIDDIVRIDPELRSFFSVNTPEALETAIRWRNEETAPRS